MDVIERKHVVVIDDFFVYGLEPRKILVRPINFVRIQRASIADASQLAYGSERIHSQEERIHFGSFPYVLFSL